MTRHTAREIEAAAADWVAYLDRHGRTAATLRDLETWLAEDGRHRGAFLQAEAAWALVGAPAEPAAAWLGGEADDAAPAPAPFLSRRRLLGGGGALAASLAAGVFFLQSPAYYETQIGEIRRVRLDDGSVVSINTDSEIAVSIGRKARSVELANGEAWFEVAKDRTRPFDVAAGPAHIRAVGTAFSVRRFPNGTEILVTEGIVDVWPTNQPTHRVRLTAGKKGFVAKNVAVAEKQVPEGEIERVLAWRANNIELAGETLNHAVEEFNRHNRRRILLLDRTLGDERLYGRFTADDPVAFARSVALSLDTHVSLDDPSAIVIGATRER